MRGHVLFGSERSDGSSGPFVPREVSAFLGRGSDWCRLFGFVVTSEEMLMNLALRFGTLIGQALHLHFFLEGTLLLGEAAFLLFRGQRLGRSNQGLLDISRAAFLIFAFLRNGAFHLMKLAASRGASEGRRSQRANVDATVALFLELSRQAALRFLLGASSNSFSFRLWIRKRKTSQFYYVDNNMRSKDWFILQSCNPNLVLNSLLPVMMQRSPEIRK